MEDFNLPVLPGTARSDYERYLRTDELLALQTPAAQAAHHDELLFQIVHQTSELWLKLAVTEVEEATALIRTDDLGGALRLLRRAIHCIEITTAQLHVLEHISPWEYHEIRKVLGHGSGFDSPGFQRIQMSAPPLGEAFEKLLERRGVTIVDVYVRARELEDLYQLAERLIDWDERNTLWRSHHLKMVERIIGGHVIGTQGTPVEILGRRVPIMFYPWLWDVRNQLTGMSKTSPESPREDMPRTATPGA
jgi:tryptophan 2,3-dioxygenase